MVGRRISPLFKPSRCRLSRCRHANLPRLHWEHKINDRVRVHTLEAVQLFLAEELALDPAKLDPELPLGELGIDSLMLMECFFKLEDEFGISLEGSGATPNTIGEITDLIDGLLAAKVLAKSWQGRSAPL